MAFETTLFSIDAGVATLTLNRPDKLNAFTVQMHAEVKEALKAVTAGGRDGSVRVLVLTGAGRGFCTGQDLGDRKPPPDGGRPNLGESLDARYNPLVRTLAGLDMPVLCAVNGVAAGAGANIALACDIVFAARSAAFIQAFCRLGLIPDSGGTWVLPRLVGKARAAGLTLLGDKITAEQAAAWGLIWQVVDDDALMGTVMETARRLATAPTAGLALIKRALAASTTNNLDAQLDLERDLQTIAGRSDDYQEGVAAFLGKRPPQFKGR